MEKNQFARYIHRVLTPFGYEGSIKIGSFKEYTVYSLNGTKIEVLVSDNDCKVINHYGQTRGELTSNVDMREILFYVVSAYITYAQSKADRLVSEILDEQG